MTGVADASNSIEQAKHGGDHSSRAAQLQARENEQKALSLWIKAATFQQIAATTWDSAVALKVPLSGDGSTWFRISASRPKSLALRSSSPSAMLMNFRSTLSL